MIHALAEFSRSQTFEDIIAASFVVMLGMCALYVLFWCIVACLWLYIFIDNGIDEYRESRGPKKEKIPFAR